MGDVYPELAAKAGYIREVTETEEHASSRPSRAASGGWRRSSPRAPRVIPGEEAFKLYDTFGFPIDLTGIIAGGAGGRGRHGRLRPRLKEQQERIARGAGPAAKTAVEAPARAHRRRPASGASVKRGKQKFVGYQTTEADTDILAFRQEGPRVELVLRENPFYAESGGQVSDVGGRRGRRAGRWRSTRCGRTPRAPWWAARSATASSPTPVRARGGRTPAARHRAEPQRHAPGARRAPEAPRHARAAAGLAGGARPAAVRLLAPRPDRRRRPCTPSSRR